jgi:hypothetical protein
MNLFFFGSLMDRELLALVSGRAADALAVTEATLHGFARRRARGESFPVIVPHPGGRVDGVLVRGLTPADLDRIQFFEGSDYAPRTFAVEAAGARVEAQVFLPTARLEAEAAEWDHAAWAADERAMCVALAEELMSHYGRLSYAEIDALWPQMKARALIRFRRARRRLGGVRR